MVCLRVGAPCRVRFAAQYRRHGFVCVRGRLRRVAPRKPPGPAHKTLALPPAQPLPAGATTIDIPASNWGGGELAADSDALWIGGGLYRLDPQGTVSPALTSAESFDIGVGAGSVWASDYDGDVVRRFDPTSGKQIAAIAFPLDSGPEGIIEASGAMWVALHHGGTLARIAPATNSVSAQVRLAPHESSGPQFVVYALGTLWVDVPNQNAVFRVDPASNRVVAKIVVPYPAEPCGGIAVGASAAWVSSCLDRPEIARIDLTANRTVAILSPGGLVNGLAADGDSVWFVEGGDPDLAPKPASLVHLAADDTVAARYALPNGFASGSVVIAFGALWVSDTAHPRVIRIPLAG